MTALHPRIDMMTTVTLLNDTGAFQLRILLYYTSREGSTIRHTERFRYGSTIILCFTMHSGGVGRPSGMYRAVDTSILFGIVDWLAILKR